VLPKWNGARVVPTRSGHACGRPCDNPNLHSPTMLLRLGTSRAPGKSSQSVTKLRDCTTECRTGAGNSMGFRTVERAAAHRAALRRHRNRFEQHAPQLRRDKPTRQDGLRLRGGEAATAARAWGSASAWLPSPHGFRLRHRACCPNGTERGLSQPAAGTRAEDRAITPTSIRQRCCCGLGQAALRENLRKV